MSQTQPPAIRRWHEVAKSLDEAGLADLIAEEAVFMSPVVHTPQVGKAITVKYLTAAFHVLNNDKFRYVNEWIGPQSAVLEFETEVNGILVNGIDIITWNADNKIVHFKVMVPTESAVLPK